jgi:hypothetical protein
MHNVRLSIQRINLIAAILVVTLAMLACNVLNRFMTPEASAATQPAPEEIPILSGATSTYNGDYNGVKYHIALPVEFVHSTSGGWEQFCLETSEKLCVSIQPQNGNWNDSEAMANEIIGGFSSTVSNYKEIDHKSTFSGDGFPAYWVGYTYTWQDTDLEGSRLFIVIQHIGFDIATEGSPALMDQFRSDTQKIVDSFLFDYN